MREDSGNRTKRCVWEWRLRLVRLKRLLAQRGNRYSWLWSIHAKVLTYLVSRYETETAQARTLPSAKKEPLGSPSAAKPMKVPATVSLSTSTGKPPKSHALIRALLEDIHRLHSFRIHDSSQMNRIWLGDAMVGTTYVGPIKK
jgi:hypothetical protein